VFNVILCNFNWSCFIDFSFFSDRGNKPEINKLDTKNNNKCVVDCIYYFISARNPAAINDDNPNTGIQIFCQIKNE